MGFQTQRPQQWDPWSWQGSPLRLLIQSLQSIQIMTMEAIGQGCERLFKHSPSADNKKAFFPMISPGTQKDPRIRSQGLVWIQFHSSAFWWWPGQYQIVYKGLFLVCACCEFCSLQAMQGFRTYSIFRADSMIKTGRQWDSDQLRIDTMRLVSLRGYFWMEHIFPKLGNIPKSVPLVYSDQLWRVMINSNIVSF